MRATRVEDRRREVLDAAGRFADAAEPLIARALEGRLEALLAHRAEWLASLRADESDALREGAADEIVRGAARVAEALREPGLWLEPSVRVDEGPEAQLDGGLNRVWIALLTAARGLDHVLGEFEMPHAETPEAGGGHYGLQPQTLEELDPRGELDRLWQRYRKRYQAFAAAARADGGIGSGR